MRGEKKERTMKRSTILSCSVVYVVSFLSCQAALSEIVNIAFEGIVNTCDARGSFMFDGSVNIGTPMSGVMTYDSTAIDQDPSVTHGDYDIITISMDIGNYTFKWPDSPSPIYNWFGVTSGDDSYTFGASPRFDGTILVDGVSSTYEDISWYSSYLSIFLGRTSLIMNDALPDADSFLPLSAFEIRQFEIRFRRAPYGDPSSFEIFGEITSLTVTPEPASILLFGLGILALRRRRAV
jgi:hypothetical protein